MDTMKLFSRMFIVMPSADAAQCLLELTNEEKIQLLQELAQKWSECLPASLVNKAEVIPALQGLWQFEPKLGAILMELSRLAGDQYVLALLYDWRQQRPDLLAAIRPYVFLFEEVLYLDDRSLQNVLRDTGLHATFLAGSSPAVTEKLLRNVSPRVGKAVLEEYEDLKERLAGSPEVFQAKSALAHKVMHMLASGVIGEVRFPLPEITLQAYENAFRQVAGYILALPDGELQQFLREDTDDYLLSQLIASGYGDAFKQRIKPLVTPRFFEHVLALASTTAPQTITQKTVFVIKKVHAAMQQK